MDELKKMLAKEFPLWVAQKQDQPQPSLQQRQVNGRLPNASQLTPKQMAENEALQRIKNITTAYA